MLEALEKLLNSYKDVKFETKTKNMQLLYVHNLCRDVIYYLKVKKLCLLMPVEIVIHKTTKFIWYIMSYFNNLIITVVYYIKLVKYINISGIMFLYVASALSKEELSRVQLTIWRPDQFRVDYPCATYKYVTSFVLTILLSTSSLVVCAWSMRCAVFSDISTFRTTQVFSLRPLSWSTPQRSTKRLDVDG